jgi:hypothetical protein
MAYSLRPRQSVERGVRRIAGELIDGAVRALRQRERHAAHHQVRKNCKKMRALLRLVREPLGAAFDDENRWYRDFARSLAGVRDAQAVIESWVTLQSMDAGRLGAERRSHIRRLLELRRDAVAVQRAPAPEDLIEELRAARRRSRAWHLDRDGFDAVAAGVARAYRRSRKLMREARAGCADGAAPDPALVHQWRKRCKDHWYQMRLLRLVTDDGSAALPAHCRELAELSDELGRHHDLQVLRQVLADLGLERTEMDAIEAAVERHSADLADAAFARGARLFAAPPKIFVAELRRRHEAACGKRKARDRRGPAP